MKNHFILLLVGLFCWLPVSSAWAGDSELIQLPQNVLITGLGNGLTEDTPPVDRSDVWMNATYALGGSALANSLTAGMIAILGLLYATLAPGGAWLDHVGPAALALELVPMVATPVLMHVWSPEATSLDYFGWSLAGSMIAGAVQLLLMVPLYLLFNQGTASESFYVLLPVALVTAILFQALGSAWGHELGENLSVSGQQLSVSSQQQGLVLSYRLTF